MSENTSEKPQEGTHNNKSRRKFLKLSAGIIAGTIGVPALIGGVEGIIEAVHEQSGNLFVGSGEDKIRLHKSKDETDKKQSTLVEVEHLLGESGFEVDLMKHTDLYGVETDGRDLQANIFDDSFLQKNGIKDSELTARRIETHNYLSFLPGSVIDLIAIHSSNLEENDLISVGSQFMEIYSVSAPTLSYEAQLKAGEDLKDKGWQDGKYRILGFGGFVNKISDGLVGVDTDATGPIRIVSFSPKTRTVRYNDLELELLKIPVKSK